MMHQPYSGAGWTSAPTAPFTYSTFPTVTFKCAGCAVKYVDGTPLNVAEVQVGFLQVCRQHVKWAIRQNRKQEDAD